MSKGLGPVQKKSLQLLWDEKKNPKSDFALYNSRSNDTRLPVDYIFRSFYSITGTQEEINKQIHELDLNSKQKIYNTLKRLHTRGLIIYGKGLVRAYIRGDCILNVKTNKEESLKRLITY